MKSEIRCAWCDMENHVEPQPHFNHTICLAHKVKFFIGSAKEHSEEVLLFVILALIAERGGAR